MNLAKMIVDSVDIETPFYDVDSFHIAWHGHYLKYFEQARCQLFDKIGYNYVTMREDGFAFPIVDIQVKYIKPLIFKQCFRVQTELLEWEHRLKIRYLIFDLITGEKLTKGYTTQVAVELASKQMLFDCPPLLIEKVNSYSCS